MMGIATQVTDQAEENESNECKYFDAGHPELELAEEANTEEVDEED